MENLKIGGKREEGGRGGGKREKKVTKIFFPFFLPQRKTRNEKDGGWGVGGRRENYESFP